MLLPNLEEGFVRLTKMERFVGHLPGLTPLYADVEYAILEIVGTLSSGSVLERQSRADAPDQMQARRLLNSVKVELEDSRLRLSNPRNTTNHRCLTEFVAMCPKNRPVTVRGIQSAVRISDLAGGADVHTTQARITILDVGPRVIGNVKEGIIDYSGHHGSVKLFAGWELNLNLTSQSFAGEMTATAEGPVRVLIPRGFTTAFEANLTKTATFVCRADIKSQIKYSESLGRAIYTFGEGTPTIRLLSLRGPIVIDNQPGESDEVGANAVLG